MTRPAYDPLRPPAPPFPGYRLRAAGLSDDAVAAVAEQYTALDYDGRIRFVRDVTRVPNEELARRYADGADAGASPSLLSPEELADAHKADALHEAAKAAGLPVSGTKVEVATRLVEAGATGGLPVVTPEQVAADAAADPQSPPPGGAAAAPAEATAPAPGADATAPGSDSPQVAPAATTDATGTPDATTAAPGASAGTTAAPTPPVAPAAGTP